MKLNSFGLDIGTTSIRIALLGKERDGLYLESIAFAPLASAGLMSDSVLEQQKLSSYIRKMIDGANIHTPHVNVSLPESQIYSRVLEMPELSEQELKTALSLEIEQYIPLQLNEVKTDSQILEHINHDNKKTMTVLIIAAPIKVLEKYNKVLDMAGLKPNVIETEIISVYRSLMPLLNDKGADIIVHLGASTTDVAVIRNKIINIVFSIPIGGAAITRAISMDFGINSAQAESFKKAYGLNEDVFEGKISKSLSPILQSIIGEIKKAILLFKEKNNNQEIRQVILSGGNALLPGLDMFFTNTLNIQVVVGNPWQLNNINNVPQEVAKEAPGHNVVVGLALRDL